MMDAIQTQEAWKRFKVYGDPVAREQLIRQYAHLVKITVNRIVPYPKRHGMGRPLQLRGDGTHPRC